MPAKGPLARDVVANDVRLADAYLKMRLVALFVVRWWHALNRLCVVYVGGVVACIE